MMPSEGDAAALLTLLWYLCSRDATAVLSSDVSDRDLKKLIWGTVARLGLGTGSDVDTGRDTRRDTPGYDLVSRIIHAATTRVGELDSAVRARLYGLAHVVVTCLPSSSSFSGQDIRAVITDFRDSLYPSVSWRFNDAQHAIVAQAMTDLAESFTVFNTKLGSVEGVSTEHITSVFTEALRGDLTTDNVVELLRVAGQQSRAASRLFEARTERRVHAERVALYKERDDWFTGFVSIGDFLGLSVPSELQVLPESVRDTDPDPGSGRHRGSAVVDYLSNVEAYLHNVAYVLRMYRTIPVLFNDVLDTGTLVGVNTRWQSVTEVFGLSEARLDDVDIRVEREHVSDELRRVWSEVVHVFDAIAGGPPATDSGSGHMRHSRRLNELVQISQNRVTFRENVCVAIDCASSESDDDIITALSTGYLNVTVDELNGFVAAIRWADVGEDDDGTVVIPRSGSGSRQRQTSVVAMIRSLLDQSRDRANPSQDAENGSVDEDGDVDDDVGEDEGGDEDEDTPMQAADEEQSQGADTDSERTTVDTLRQENVELERRAREILAERTRIQEELAATKARVEEMGETIAALRTAAADNANNIMYLERQVEELTKTAETAKEEERTLSGLREKWQQEKAVLVAEKERLTTVLRELQTTSESEMTSLQSGMEKLTTERDGLLERIRTLERDATVVASTKDAHITELERALGTCEAANASLNASVVGALRSADAERKNVTASYTTLMSMIEDLVRMTSDAARPDLSGIRTEVGALVEQLREIQTRGVVPASVHDVATGAVGRKAVTVAQRLLEKLRDVHDDLSSISERSDMLNKVTTKVRESVTQFNDVVSGMVIAMRSAEPALPAMTAGSESAQRRRKRQRVRTLVDTGKGDDDTTDGGGGGGGDK